MFLTKKDNSLQPSTVLTGLWQPCILIEFCFQIYFCVGSIKKIMFSVEKNANYFQVANMINKGYFFTKMNKVISFCCKMALKIKPNRWPLNKF